MNRFQDRVTYTQLSSPR